MKNALFLLGRYFPKASPNSLCMQNIIEALPSDQYSVHIVAYDDGFEDSYRVAVTKFKRNIIQRKIYHTERKTTKFSNTTRKVLNACMKIIQIPFLPIWPWTDPVTTFREWRCVKRLVAEQSFDVVVSVYMPLSSIIVGSWIKKKNPAVKYCVCFLDPLAGGYIPRYTNGSMLEKSARRWEKKLLVNADKVIFMESMRNYRNTWCYDDLLNEKIEYLDLPVLVQRSAIAEQKTNKKEITFLYVGSLPMSIRSPEYLLKVFEQLENPSFRFVFIGDSNCNILNEYATRDKRVSVIGRLPHSEIVIHEQKADILVNIGNSNSNLTPSKIFEYISYGKPIISTYCIDEDTSRFYLKRYSLACCIDQRKTVKETIVEIDAFINKNLGKSVKFEQVEKMYYANTPQAFVDSIFRRV